MGSSSDNSSRKLTIGSDPIEPVDDFSSVEVDSPKPTKKKSTKSASSKKVESKVGKGSQKKSSSKATNKDSDAVAKSVGKRSKKSTDTPDEKIEDYPSGVEKKKGSTPKASTAKTKSAKTKKLKDEPTKTGPSTKKSSKKPKETAPVKSEVYDVPPMFESKPENTEPKHEPKGLDLLISFDTTGSMYPVLANVRREVDYLVRTLASKIKDIQIGVIAHGDYCDANAPYTIRFLDFTDDVAKLSDFINNTKPTYGGDADECYELVLRTGRTQASWRPDSTKIFMVIGDANPHSESYPLNSEHIRWQDESKQLSDMHIQVFGVHCLHKFRQSSTKFYQKIADDTNGVYLTLDQFSDITGLIEATCYSQYSEEKLTEFVTIIRNNRRLTNGLARNINRLSGKELVEGLMDDSDYPSKSSRRTGVMRGTDTTLVQAAGLIPVTPGRFQTMEVDTDMDIRSFVEFNGIIFKRGRGFYELSKSEKVQQYKEIILEDRETGEMYSGAQVREYLGLQPQIAKGGVTERLNSHHTNKYRVFVQSTSVNRKLIGGTKLLYEVDFDR